MAEQKKTDPSKKKQLTDKELEDRGISSDLVRYSCGLENADDLISDIRQALNNI